MLRWFIGYDKDESVSAYVLAHSLHRHSSIPVSVTFINRDNLAGIYKRERTSLESTDFSITRFLVPYMCGFEGWAVFSDCDMLCRDDPAKLWAWREDNFAVRVVKHTHIPTESKKFLGQTQSKYEKKNWSSVILFNNSKCKALTPEYVNTASGLDLHQFKWLERETLIGDLPGNWNHLVDYDPPNSKACLVHWTKGGPWFPEYANAEHHMDWWKESTLMGHFRK